VRQAVVVTGALHRWLWLRLCDRVRTQRTPKGPSEPTHGLGTLAVEAQTDLLLAQSR
jgi:hypothetical protein